MGVGPITRIVRSRSMGPAAGGSSTGSYQLGRMGSVQQMVAGFNLGWPLAAIPNMSALDSTARRHDDDADDDDDDDDDDNDDG